VQSYSLLFFWSSCGGNFFFSLSNGSGNVIALKITVPHHWLQVSEVSLKQVEKFKYPGIAFTSDERHEWEELDNRMDKACTEVEYCEFYNIRLRYNENSCFQFSKQSSSPSPTSHMLSWSWLCALGVGRKNTMASVSIWNVSFAKVDE